MYNYFWSYIGSHHVCFSKQIFSSHYNTFISYDNVKPCKCFPLLFPTLWKFIHICRINHIAVFFFGLANKLRPSVCHPGMPLLAPGNLIVFFLLIVFLDRCRITFIRLLFHTFQLSSHFEHFFFFFLRLVKTFSGRTCVQSSASEFQVRDYLVYFTCRVPAFVISRDLFVSQTSDY